MVELNVQSKNFKSGFCTGIIRCVHNEKFFCISEYKITRCIRRMRGRNESSSSSSSSSFGLFPIRGRHSRYLHFYYMAFVLRSDAFPATKPLFGGKTGPPVFHMKAGASR